MAKAISPKGAYSDVVKDLAAGVEAVPQEITVGSAKATYTFTFTANPTAGHTITLRNNTFTFAASAADGTEITIAGSKASTLDAIRSAFAAVAELDALFTFTDDNTSVVTCTAKKAGVAANGVTVASSNANCVAAAGTTGVDGDIDLKAKTTIINTAVTSAKQLYMADGVEGQEHVFYVQAMGASGSMVVNYNASGTLTLAEVGQSAILKFLNGDWRVMLAPVVSPPPGP